jgi:hypothetical protein
MTILKYIRNLFSANGNVDAHSPISKEDKRKFTARFNDVGQFTYTDDGCIVQLNTEQEEIKWADIERLVAYKRDFYTSDEICLDIVFNNCQITISEETPGWYQFVERIKLVYPEISQNWDTEIVHPPFATNLTVLYQRKDRIMAS